MDAETADKLRAPFPPEQIGKLPKPTKKDNPRGHCDVCNGYHGLPAIHLEYVGHAAVTDRLLQADPGWTWEPVALTDSGLPLITDGGLWIRLTVGGVTRLGYGDATMGKGVKEMIGDAIRNAAMRFGVGLDLWAKEGLAIAGKPDEQEGITPSQPSASAAEPGPTPERTGETDQERRLRMNGRLFAMVTELQTVGAPFPSGTPANVTTWDEWRKAYMRTKYGKQSASHLTLDELSGLIERVKREHDAYPWPV